MKFCTGLFFIAMLAASAHAADWPTWRGPSHDGTSAESSGWPNGWPPKKLWEHKVGYGCTSPVIAGGRLYVMGWASDDASRPRGNPTGTDTLYCFDLSSGKELWKQTYRCRYQSRIRTGDTGSYGGPSATPTFDGSTNFIYTLSTDGDLQCRDTAKGGELVWGRNLFEGFEIRQRPDSGGGVRDFGFTCSPFIAGDQVIVELGATSGTVAAFDKGTGEHRWNSDYNKPAGHSGGFVPIDITGKGYLALLTLNNLVLFDYAGNTPGKTIAQYPWQTQFGCNIPTPAAVEGGGFVLTGGYNNHSSVLVRYEKGTFEQIWKSRPHAVVSSPVVCENRVFIIGGNLQCLDLESGELLWRGGGFGNGSCIATADGKIIAFGQGRLALLDATADQYTEFSKIEHIVPATCYPHIAYSAGVIAVKDRDGHLVCFSTK